jgi:hypothetical protein
VVFKLCAAALWGAVRNLKGAVRNLKGAVRNLKGAANFFRQFFLLQFFIEICLGVPRKIFGLFQGAASQKV